jgi:hypothetical protein
MKWFKYKLLIDQYRHLYTYDGIQMKPLSSFELIVQPLIPPSVAPPGLPNPISIEAYFLTLSNYTNAITSIELELTANPNTDGPSNFNGGGIVPTGSKNFGPVGAFLSIVGATPLFSPNFKIENEAKAKANFDIPPLGTVLFLLQPDVTPLREFDKVDEEFSYELRGLISIDSSVGTLILCSPQIRGTFLELEKIASMPNATDDGALAPAVYAQQAYALPTAQNALYTF